jgi:Protein of unknown function (DUF2752)
MEPNADLARRRKLYGTFAAGTLCAGALTYVGVADPHRRDALFPPCPFKMLTGWNCPACGGLRMTHDLIHGNLAAAVVDNVYLLVGIPVLVAWILYCLRTGRQSSSKSVIVVVVLSAIAWTVTRNLPGFPLVPTLYGR